MLSLDQIEIKNKAMGGSDIGALFGESPWAQPMDIWQRVTGRHPLTAEDAEADPDTPASLGSEMEVVLRNRYAKRLSDDLGEEIKVRERHKPRFHVEHDFLAGNIDADVVGHRRLGELKLVLFGDRALWGEQGTDEVPAHYLLQVHFYLLLYDYEMADLFAWFGRNDFRRYEFVRRPEIDALILERAVQFWNDHVIADVPPPLDYAHPQTERILKELYPGTNGERIVLPDEAIHYHAVLKDLQKRRKDIETAESEMRNRLRDMVGENAVGLLPGGGGYKRAVVQRKGYTVEPSEYETFSFSGNLKAPES